MTLALGHSSVKACKEAVSSREFSEWVAYHRLYPFGPVREDQRAFEIVAILANVNRDKKKRRQPYTWQEIAGLTRQVTPQSPDEQLRIVEMLNAIYGGEDLRETKTA